MSLSLGMIVEGSVAVLLVVTIAYCVVLNSRLKRLHGDREMLAKMIGDLVHATSLAQGAIKELKAAGTEVEGRLDQRLTEAAELDAELAAEVAKGAQLLEKIAKITAVSKVQPAAVIEAQPARVAVDEIEPQSRLHAALQQLAMRPKFGSQAA